MSLSSSLMYSEQLVPFLKVHVTDGLGLGGSSVLRLNPSKQKRISVKCNEISSFEMRNI